MKTIKKTGKSDSDYPILMTTDDIVVLFSSDSTGVVIHGDTKHGVGHYSESWDMGVFKRFNGSITLSND